MNNWMYEVYNIEWMRNSNEWMNELQWMNNEQLEWERKFDSNE